MRIAMIDLSDSRTPVVETTATSFQEANDSDLTEQVLRETLVTGSARLALGEHGDYLLKRIDSDSDLDALKRDRKRYFIDASGRSVTVMDAAGRAGTAEEGAHSQIVTSGDGRLAALAIEELTFQRDIGWTEQEGWDYRTKGGSR